MAPLTDGARADTVSADMRLLLCRGLVFRADRVFASPGQLAFRQTDLTRGREMSSRAHGHKGRKPSPPGPSLRRVSCLDVVYPLFGGYFGSLLAMLEPRDSLDSGFSSCVAAVS